MPTVFDLFDMMANVDPNHLLKCNLCDKEMTGLEHNLVHLRHHMGYRPHKCTYCDHADFGLGEMGSHLEENHPELYLPPNDSQRTIIKYKLEAEKEKELWDHLRKSYEHRFQIQHSSLYYFKCPETDCHREIHGLKDLAVHLENHLGKWTYMCKTRVCKKVHSSREDVKDHLAVEPHNLPKSKIDEYADRSRVVVNCELPAPTPNWLQRKMFAAFAKLREDNPQIRLGNQTIDAHLFL